MSLAAVVFVVATALSCSPADAVIRRVNPRDMWEGFAAQYPFTESVGTQQPWQWTETSVTGTTGRYFVDETRSAFLKVGERFLDYDHIRREAFVLFVLERLGVSWSPRLLWTNNRDRIITTWSGTPVFAASRLPHDLKEQLDTILSDLSRLGLQHNDMKVNELLVSGESLSLIDFGSASVDGDVTFGQPEYLDSRTKPLSIIPDGVITDRLRGLWELADFLADKHEPEEENVGPAGVTLYSHPARRVGSQRETPSVTFRSLPFGELSIAVRGYQSFDLSTLSLTTTPKVELVLHALAPFLHGKENVSAVDLGGSTGHLLFAMALFFRDKTFSRTLLEHDRDAVEVVLRVKALLVGYGHEWEGLGDIEIIQERLTQPNNGSIPRKDIVTALALVHWLYSCTAHFGSLDAVVAALASFAKPGGLFLVEWVDPQDVAIQEFQHTQFNENVHQAPYNRQEFEAALGRYCAEYQESGYTNSPANTRILFRCILRL